MAFRIATKTELDPYFSILWQDYISLCMEVDQAGDSLLLSLSLLAVCTDFFVESFSCCAIQADAKRQQVFTCRIRIVLHGASGWNLDPIEYFE